MSRRSGIRSCPECGSYSTMVIGDIDDTNGVGSVSDNPRKRANSNSSGMNDDDNGFGAPPGSIICRDCGHVIEFGTIALANVDEDFDMENNAAPKKIIARRVSRKQKQLASVGLVAARAYLEGVELTNPYTSPTAKYEGSLKAAQGAIENIKKQEKKVKKQKVIKKIVVNYSFEDIARYASRSLYYSMHGIMQHLQGNNELENQQQENEHGFVFDENICSMFYKAFSNQRSSKKSNRKFKNNTKINSKNSESSFRSSQLSRSSATSAKTLSDKESSQQDEEEGEMMRVYIGKDRGSINLFILSFLFYTGRNWDPSFTMSTLLMLIRERYVTFPGNGLEFSGSRNHLILKDTNISLAETEAICKPMTFHFPPLQVDEVLFRMLVRIMIQLELKSSIQHVWPIAITLLSFLQSPRWTATSEEYDFKWNLLGELNIEKKLASLIILAISIGVHNWEDHIISISEKHHVENTRLYAVRTKDFNQSLRLKLNRPGVVQMADFVSSGGVDSNSFEKYIDEMQMNCFYGKRTKDILSKVVHPESDFLVNTYDNNSSGSSSSSTSSIGGDDDGDNRIHHFFCQSENFPAKYNCINKIVRVSASLALDEKDVDENDRVPKIRVPSSKSIKKACEDWYSHAKQTQRTVTKELMVDKRIIAKRLFVKMMETIIVDYFKGFDSESLWSNLRKAILMIRKNEKRSSFNAMHIKAINHKLYMKGCQGIHLC